MVGNYEDQTVIPIRHMGRGLYPTMGIPAYVDPVIAMSGTIVATPTEAQVIAGGTIILTLSQAKWIASGAVFNAVRQAIIDGLDSDKSEVTGWNTLVRDAIAVTTVVRTSDTVVTVTIPASPAYNISADEIITFTCPRSAIEGAPVILLAAVCTIANATPTVTCAMTGTLGETPAESTIIAGAATIVLTLTGGTFVPATQFNLQRANIIAGMVSDGSEAHGWDVEVLGALAVTDVVRTSATVCTITLPAVAAYNIAADETVTITIPRLAVVQADAAVVVTEQIAVAHTDATVALTGTLISGPAEANVVTGGYTIIATLTGGVFPADGADFEAVRQDIIDGMVSSGAETLGWNAEVRDKEVVTAVVRTSATVCTITLTASASYALIADEEITVTLPTSAVLGADTGIAGTPFTIVHTAATAALTGTFLTTPTEAEVVSGGQTIIITLTGAIWAAVGAAFNAQRQTIIDGITAAEAEATGWNVLVKGAIPVTSVIRTSDTIVTITLPAVGDYVITADENVTVTVPASAIVGETDPVVASPVIVIANA